MPNYRMAKIFGKLLKFQTESPPSCRDRRVFAGLAADILLHAFDELQDKYEMMRSGKHFQPSKNTIFNHLAPKVVNAFHFVASSYHIKIVQKITSS